MMEVRKYEETNSFKALEGIQKIGRAVNMKSFYTYYYIAFHAVEERERILKIERVGL